MFYNDDVQLVFWNLKSTQMGRHFSNKYQEKLDSWCHVLMPYINGPFAFQPLEHFIETVAGWNSTVEHCCTFHQSQSRAPPLKSALGASNSLQNQLIWINLLHTELKNHFTKTFFLFHPEHGGRVPLEANSARGVKTGFSPDRAGWQNWRKEPTCYNVTVLHLLWERSQQSCNNLSRWSKLRSLRLRIQPRMRMKWHCAESVVKNVSLSFGAASKSLKQICLASQSPAGVFSAAGSPKPSHQHQWRFKMARGTG